MSRPIKYPANHALLRKHAKKVLNNPKRQQNIAIVTEQLDKVPSPPNSK